MRPLARRLRQAGFEPVLFGYPSRTSPARIAERFGQWLNEHDPPPDHFVAHSLGGIVLAHLFVRHPELGPTRGRIVLLGSPLAGSAIARRLAEWRVGRWLLGGSLHSGLADGGPAWTTTDTLMLAGTRPIGPGRLVPQSLTGPNDGTVSVAETLDAGLAAHRCLPVNHFALLWSGQVAAAVIDYLSSSND
ncbi:MAG: esterase/lipase family protein [Guyparkeria sp.]